MLTLITGLPGASKTLNTLVKVSAECIGREIYYYGIADLTLDWTLVTEEQLLNWFDFPVGSVFVVDESQRVWPSRPNTKEAPESVKRMDKHRHQGIDFYLITQKPTNLDHGVRGFVQRHFHYERLFSRNGAREVEFQLCANDPQDKHLRKTAQSKWVPFNKKFYDKYKSAEIHTYKPKVPRSLYVVAAGLVFALGMGAFMVNKMWSGDDQAPLPVSLNSTDLPYDPSYDGLENHQETTEEYIDKFTPRISDLPYTAPVYDKITEVKTYPRPQCLFRKKTNICKCYTQQATPLDISFSMCMNIVQNGWFNPFQEEQLKEASAYGGGTTPAVADLSSDPGQTTAHPLVVYPSGTTTNRVDRLADHSQHVEDYSL